MSKFFYSVLDLKAWSKVTDDQYLLLVDESSINLKSSSNGFVNLYFSSECRLQDLDNGEDIQIIPSESGYIATLAVKKNSVKSVTVTKGRNANLSVIFSGDVISNNVIECLVSLGYKLPQSDVFEKGFPENASHRYVIFTSFGNDNSPVEGFEFEGHFKNIEDGVLFLRDNTRQWYQGGITGFSSSFEETCLKLRNFIAGAENVTFVGVSMGGFAALQFGQYLSVSRILVVSPQINISTSFRNEIRETRWKRHLDLVNQKFSERQLLMKVPPNSSKTLVEIFVSSNDELDMKHVSAFPISSNVTVHLVDSDDHYLAGRLASSGELFRALFPS
ncbi:hypothetical protein I633_18265 [Alteromonas mediterranea 615]|uniref:Uncharacterized protein n=1 Tax=Alteromonas mediterranea 615 TaxID=1300253 RepID=S5AJS6_9ALTE|nr:hypothetical protein I633_18265 [Alteromonas mediterranea 615]